MLDFLYSLSVCTFIVILLLTVLILLYYKRAFRYWEKMNIPYPKPCFPLGNFDSYVMNNIGQTVSNIYHEMKLTGTEYCGYYMFAMPVFMPISTELIKEMIIVNFTKFHDRGFHYDEENDPMGASILTYTGEKWRKMRAILNPTFSSAKLKILFPIIAASGIELENVLEKVTKTSEPLNINDIAARYTTDIICSSAFGLECNSLKNPDTDFRKYGRMVFSNCFSQKIRVGLGATAPAVLKFFKITLFMPTAVNFFRQVVIDTVSYREKNKIVRNDLMNLLIKLKNNESIDDEATSDENMPKGIETITMNEVASHCLLYFLAGFETSSNLIHFCMYELAANPKVQNKARQEIIRVLKKYNGEITYEAISEMRYLENVIHETLRKYPPVNMLNRICTEDFEIPGKNIIIKKGTKVVISILGIHWDPEYYPNPDTFDPDRFSDKEKAKRHPFTFIPFGDGPRICPGMRLGIYETIAAVTSMIKKYKFKVHPKMKQPLKTSSVGAVLTSVEPILLLPERL